MDMKIQIELPPTFYRLENKVVTARELARYLGAGSPSELLLILRQLTREGYLKFEVVLSAEYFRQDSARRTLLLRADVLNPIDLFGTMQHDANRLSVNSETLLSEAEILEVIRKLPVDMAERYLRLRLLRMDKEKLRELTKAMHKHDRQRKVYGHLEYNGLVFDGAGVSYYSEPIKMNFQHQQVVRLLLQMKKRDRLCTRDDFKDDSEIFTRQSYDEIDITLVKLIAAVRKELKSVIKNDCIKNEREQGWYLEIEP